MLTKQLITGNVYLLLNYEETVSLLMGRSYKSTTKVDIQTG